MAKRFVAIWFRHLTTDWVIRRKTDLQDVPFVLAAPERGRMVVKAANKAAQSRNVAVGMVVADCRAILPALLVYDDMPALSNTILTSIAEWCLRYTPIASVDLPDGIILDITGCAHLWGGEREYLRAILNKLRDIGYDTRAAMADTIGAAWAISRYGRKSAIIETDKHKEALLSLPPVALRLPPEMVERLEKLGLSQIKSFIDMPRAALRRRFGDILLQQLDRAVGSQREHLMSVCPIEPYQARLPCLEPIRTRKGIEIALERLLEQLCQRLKEEDKGLRNATFKGYRMDGEVQQIDISTIRPARDAAHLLKLFSLKIQTMQPNLGFELFVLEARNVEDLSAALVELWHMDNAEHEKDVAELLDRIAGRIGVKAIHRYLPAEHYWPERSVKQATSLQEQSEAQWRTDQRRPVHLLPRPELIEVMVPLPDYPPILFHYKGKPHRVKKADGPERIEKEWWLEEGEHRDYYCVEDEAGGRYWLFRLGSYVNNNPQWFIHGFFA